MLPVEIIDTGQLRGGQLVEDAAQYPVERVYAGELAPISLHADLLGYDLPSRNEVGNDRERYAAFARLAARITTLAI